MMDVFYVIYVRCRTN